MNGMFEGSRPLWARSFILHSWWVCENLDRVHNEEVRSFFIPVGVYFLVRWKDGNVRMKTSYEHETIMA